MAENAGKPRLEVSMSLSVSLAFLGKKKNDRRKGVFYVFMWNIYVHEEGWNWPRALEIKVTPFFNGKYTISILA